MRPGDVSACFGAGVAAFMLGQDDVARRRFESALALNPTFVPAAVWLGDLHYRAGRLSEAIATYEAVAAPQERELQRQLDDWRREQALQSRFQTERTDHFTALFAADADANAARAVLERLEAAYSRIGHAIGIYPSQTTTVVLYTRQQFDDITRLPEWSVAAYDGRIRVPLDRARDRPEELDRLLSHEFTHALVARIGGRTVPAWLNEGLATVLEPDGFGAPDARPTFTGNRPALTDLHSSFVGLSTRDAEMAYAWATRAVRRLMELRGTPAVVALLEDLSRGTTFDDAFRRRMTMRYEAFTELLARD